MMPILTSARRVSIAAFTAILLGGLSLPARAGSDSLTLTITGTVVAQPCTIPPADENIKLELGNIVNKELQRDKRSKVKPFVIHLEECDLGVAKGVKATFSGAASSEDTKLLGLAGGSIASGIALGFVEGKESPKDLPLNQLSGNVALATGKNELNFGIYVQLLKSGESTLVPGDFNATSTVKLTYE